MFFGGIKLTQKEALIFQTPAMEMPWHVSVEKNQVTELKNVHAMLYLTEEEGNNVQQHSIQHRNCILWISFNIKSESEMVSLSFTVCFGIV